MYIRFQDDGLTTFQKSVFKSPHNRQTPDLQKVNKTLKKKKLGHASMFFLMF